MGSLRWNAATLRCLFLLYVLISVPCLSLSALQQQKRRSVLPFSNGKLGFATTNRRGFVSSASGLITALVFSGPTLRAHASTTVVLRLERQGDRAGLELQDVVIGANTRAAIVKIFPNGQAARMPQIQPGMILKQDAKTTIDKLQSGPFPLELEIENLAGDVLGDMGKPIIAPGTALRAATSSTSPAEGSTNAAANDNYIIRNTHQTSPNTSLQSRRGDVLEIQYDAYYEAGTTSSGETKLVLYDSSHTRGTGQPYQFVLGSGDMIPGVDLGCYEMKPGDQRVLEIPPAVGYGPRALQNFGIPAKSRLIWEVELVAVNSVREGDERTREELEGRFAY